LIAFSLPVLLLTSPLQAEETVISEPAAPTEANELTTLAAEPETSTEAAPETQPEETITEAQPEQPATEEAITDIASEEPSLVETTAPELPTAESSTISNDVSDIQPVLAEDSEPSPEAAKPAVLVELLTLVEQGNYVMAYELATSHRQDWEGDGEFDFNYGVAAAQTGHYNEAVFSFERLLEAYPGNARFRLELARCHYQLGNLTLAETEFKRVAAQNPPAAVQQNIERFLTRIAEQRQQVSPSWQGGLDVAAGYDSNINAATDLDAVQATFYLGTPDDRTALNGLLTLEDEQKAQSSAYGQFQGYIVHQRPVTKRSNIDISVSGSYKDNTEDDSYDLGNAALSGGFRLIRGAHNLRFGGSYRHYWLSADSLQSQSLGNLHWQWLFMPQWKTGIQFEAGHQNNDQNNALDFYQWQSKFNLSRSSDGFSQNIQLALGADEALEKENKFQGRSYIGFGYQARQALSDSSQLFALLNYRDNQYQDEFDALHPFYANEKRKDQLTQLILGWNYAFNQSMGAKLQLNHSQNSSNLELYEYERTQLELGANFRF
jgi:tetratricopeptide (TPR) repeat protein